MRRKTRFILVSAILAVSAQAATAANGIIPFDTLACRDNKILDSFADVMRRTTATAFFAYVNRLIKSGECEKLVKDEPVTFITLNDGRTCLSLSSRPCMVSILDPRVLEEPALAATVPALTTGQAGFAETTGSVRQPVTRPVR